MSPWPRPCHLFSLSCPFLNRSLSLSVPSWAKVTPPLSLSALSGLSPASPEVCQLQPHLLSPVTQDAHSQSACLHLHARPSIVQGSLFCRLPATPVPRRLVSGEAGYNLALLVSFSPSLNVPWHASRPWGSLWDPLVYVFFTCLRDKRQIGI